MRLRIKGLFLPLLLIVLSGFQTLPKSKTNKDFPKPDGQKHQLFYLQRTININTIIYALNINDKDELDPKEPIKAYWINYEKNKSKESLNYLQRSLAYGLEFKLIDPEKKSYCFNFVSYKRRSLYLIKNPQDGKYEVFCTVNSKLVLLNRIYIHIVGGTLMAPKIKYVEITGKDPLKKEDVQERISP